MTNAPWPMFHNNYKHTGQTNINVSGVKQNPFIIWNYSIDGSIYDSSPSIGEDGTVYIGSSDGMLYAIKDNVLQWSFNTGGDIYSSPAIGNDGTVYIGSTSDKLYAILNGIEQWCFETNNDFCSSPAVSTNGIIYIGNKNGYLYAITNGSILWACDLSSSIDGSSPAIANDGTIYIGTTGDSLYAITNGAIKWSTNLGSDIKTSPTIGPDGTIYITTWEGRLYAFTDSGTQASTKWNYFDSYAGSGGYSSPAVDDDGTVYFGTYVLDTLYAVTNGAEKWSYTAWDGIHTSPSVSSNGIVYFGTKDGNLYAVTNGTEKWSLYLTSSIDRCSPAISSDNKIYIGAQDTLFAIRGENIPVLSWTSNTGFSNDGVNPNTNYSGAIFNFEIKYIDLDNDYPIAREVWVDLNDNGVYETTEKYTMASNSGTNYSTGIIYSRSIQAFLQGDGILNYTFHFINQYGFTNEYFTNTFTVTNAPSTHNLTVNKTWEGGTEFQALTNQTVMAVQIWDSDGDTLTGFKVGNSGDMTAGSHINRVKLWYDNNADQTWDSSDTFVSDLFWDGTSLWTNNNITFSTSLSFPKFNYLVTIDLRTNLIQESNTFQAYIPANGVSCSGAGTSPSSGITNNNPVSAGQFLYLRKLTPGVYLSSIAYGDIDNDGDLDLLFVGSSGSQNYLRRCINDGNGNFSSYVDFGTRVYDASIVLGDIDNDGDLDLIVTGFNDVADRELQLYINPGNGNYNPPVDIGTGNGTVGGEIALADINNDGFLDMIISGSFELLACYYNTGEGSFQGPSMIDTGVERGSIALGDIDNDGDIDLIASGMQAEKKLLFKYLNNGLGGFSSSVSFGESISYSSIALGDINEDGYLDLVTSGENNRLDRYINDGTGTFSDPICFGTPVENSSIALGDLNNDGKLDLITSGYNQAEGLVLKKYYNQGGSLTNEQSFGNGVYKGSLALGDLNNDGSLDLLVTGTNKYGTCFDYYKNIEKENNQSPSGAPSNLKTTNINGYWCLQWTPPADDHTSSMLMQYHVGIGVIQNDFSYTSTNIDYPRGQVLVGNVPISCSNFIQTRIPDHFSIYWKVCAIDTSFKYGPFSTICSNITNTPHQLTVITNCTVDSTNLAVDDVLIMSIHIQDTHNHNLNSIKISNAGDMLYASDITNVELWEDVNHNYIWDNSDIYVADLPWNGTYWSNSGLNYTLTPAGKDFVLTVDFATTVTNTRYFQPVIPKGGITCTSNTNAPLSALINQGQIWFKYSFIRNMLDTPDAVYNGATCVVGDLNSDGWIDILIAGFTGSKRVDRYMNNQDGTFSYTASHITPGLDVGYIALGDLDNDGDLDVVWTGESGSGQPIHMRKNDGNGNFNTSSLYTIGPNMSYGCIRIGDIDNDGDLDIVCAGQNRLEYYLNDGSANFSSANSFGVGVGYCSISLSDLDNDGDMDLVVAGSDRLDKYTNPGNGQFSNPEPFGNGDTRTTIASGDINNDGWIDLIIAGNNGFFRYINNQDGTFTGTQFYDITFLTRAISLGDIDNDGDLDLIVTGHRRTEIFYNPGDGIFIGPYRFGRGIGNGGWTASGALGDFDNDNDLDLVCAGEQVGAGGLWSDFYYNVHDGQNTAPQPPINLVEERNRYYWRLHWEPNTTSDDHTPDSLLRYQVQIGVGEGSSGDYNHILGTFDYPRGAANIGNVATMTGCFYNSAIFVNNTVYWRVRSIDTSFVYSDWSSERETIPTGEGPYYVSTNGSDNNPGTYNRPFRTIQQAVNAMSRGLPEVNFPWTYVLPGEYNENVIISSNKNEWFMVISAYSNDNPPILNGGGTNACAFDISNAQDIRIYHLHIKNYTNSGIKIDGPLTNFVISHCSIYSNEQHGITINSDGADNYHICTNKIWENNGKGIIIQNGDDHIIYRNLLHHNGTNIVFTGSASGIDLINNTITKSKSGDGVLWEDTSAGNVFNNIFLSNNQYGVNTPSSGNIIFKFNTIYGDLSGPTNGGLNWGRGNWLKDPYLETVTSYTITSQDSFAVDSGTNIINYISGTYNNRGPDMGFWESGYERVHNGPYYVDITNGNDAYPGSFEAPFETINRATTRIGTGTDVTSSTCYIMPGEYSESVEFLQNNNSGYMVFKPYYSNSHVLLNGSDTYTIGIYIDDTSKILIDRFHIKNFTSYGVQIRDNSYSNTVKNSIICSNNSYGLNLYSDSADDNSVYSNEIYNNSFYGIYIYRCDNIKIYRNLIRSHSSRGIYINYYATNIQIINNTLYDNGLYGLYFINSSAGDILNNIIMNHTSYGVYTGTSSFSNLIYVDYNDFWGNNIDILSTNIIDQGPTNYFDPPVIDTTTSFTIMSPYSIAVDHATIIPGISDTYNEAGPDIGWKESSFAFSNTRISNVHIIPMNIWTETITQAVNTATNNCIVECHIHPFYYTESVLIRSKTNLIIRAFDWTNNKNNTTTIIDADIYNRAIIITNSKNITIQGFTIRNADQYGIYIVDSISNEIIGNRIHNHDYYGIYTYEDDADYTTIQSNEIFNNDSYGVYIYYGDYTRIIRNAVYRNNSMGLYLRNNTTEGESDIINNTIYNNESFGVYGISSVINAYNNVIFSNQSYGLFRGSGTIYIKNNVFYSNANSDWVNATVIGPNYTGIDPMIDTVTSFTITSSNSICVDSGTNITGISIPYNGSAADIGWKESSFTYPFYVHIISPVNTWTNTINNALLIVTNNAVIECYAKPGGFQESVDITDRTNIVLCSAEWNSNRDNTSVIIQGSGDKTVFINNSKNITLQGFTINDAGRYGVTIYNAQSNRILNNRIYDNTTAGVLIASDLARNNEIISNTIWRSSSQSYGIMLTNCKNNLIRENRIHHVTSQGIYFNNTAQSNKLIRNEICSNSSYGIYIYDEEADYNSIISNRIYRNNYGMRIQNADNIWIIRNVIYRNSNYGMYVSSSSDTDIINNTIFGSTSRGIYSISSSLDIYNNLILSNGQYGIYGNNTAYVGYNLIYGYNTAAWNNNVSVVAGNITNTPPLIELAYPFSITNVDSPCVDNAQIISNVSEDYNGTGPDMGYLESNYTNLTPEYVYVLPPINVWTNTINNALTLGSKNFIIQCYPQPGGFDESVIITDKTNITIRSYTWTNSNDNTSTVIWGEALKSVITITNSENVFIQGFTIRNGKNGLLINEAVSIDIHNNNIYDNDNNGIMITNSKYITARSNNIFENDYGVLITASPSNQILHNRIYNNNPAGLYLSLETSDYNVIASNHFYRTSYQYNGIELVDGDHNDVYKNKSHHHYDNGIYIHGTSSTNNIRQNEIYSNSDRGIYIYSDTADNNSIISNWIYRNNSRGIWLRFPDNTLIARNILCYNNSYGIWVYSGAEQTEIYNNTLYRNSSSAIAGWASTFYVFNNIILSNDNYGIDDNSCTIHAGYNLIYGHTTAPWDNISDEHDGNVTNQPPLIELQYPYAIMSPMSPAVDSASNNIPGITDVWNEDGADMGWLESPYFRIYHEGPYFVSTNGDDSNHGTFTNPFQTIQKASDVMMQGVTVASCYISPHPFLEKVTVNTNPNSGYMVFTQLSNKKPDLLGSGQTNKGFYIHDVSYIHINGIKFNAYSNAFFLTNTTHIRIENCDISSNGYGVRFNNSHSNEVISNLFTYNKYFFSNPAGLYLENNSDENLIQLNTFLSNKIGIYAENNHKGNRMDNNRFLKGSDSAIRFNYTKGSNLIINNTIAAHYNGIHLENVTNLYLYNNTVISNHNHGIYLYSGVSNNIVNSTCFSNTIDGIHIQEIVSGTVNNNISSNNTSGIYIRNARNLNINGNKCNKNRDKGIFLDNVSLSTANNNFCNENRDGLYLNIIKQSYIHENQCNNNSGKGIFLINSTNTILSTNICSANAEAGISLQYMCRSNTITKNRVNGANTTAWAGIIIQGDQNKILTNFSYHNTGDGIKIETNQYPAMTSRANHLIGNHVYSNNNMGIFLFGPRVSSSTLINNICYSNNAGIFIEDAGYNYLFNNRVYKNYDPAGSWGTGIHIKGPSKNNIIFSNFCLNNDYLADGIRMENSRSNVLTNNYISLHQTGIKLDNETDTYIINNKINSNIYGLSLNNADNNTLMENSIILNRTNGIKTIYSTNNIIAYNYIVHNLNGLYYNESSSSVYLNSISSNSNGITLLGEDFIRLDKNNLQDNKKYSLYNLQSPVKVTNNWWGSTIVTNIMSMISNNGGYSNFIPYRLFGEFNISPGEDTDPLPRIAFVTTYFTNGDHVRVRWSSTSGGDFSFYNVYWTTNNTGWSNLTYQYVKTQFSTIGQTNYLDYNLVEGTNYYFITAMDNVLYTNESWYSMKAQVIVEFFTMISLSKSISNVQLGMTPETAIPGTTITYKICYSNLGIAPGRNIIIYDRITPYVTYHTNILGTATGWTLEYSTNVSPSQVYDSTNYTNSYINKSAIKWIRWKKGNIAVDEDNRTLVYKVILK